MYKQGQLWLVNFEPSVGHEYQKVRPALIVEADVGLPMSKLTTVVPISSQVQKNSLLDVWLPKDVENRPQPVQHPNYVIINKVNNAAEEHYLVNPSNNHSANNCRFFADTIRC
jgi:mRNA interferase MazF